MEERVVIYSLKGCEFCYELKSMLDAEGIHYKDLDIHENEKEYGMFKKLVKNPYIPAFMVFSETGDLIGLYSPGNDYNTMEEAFTLIKGLM